MIGLVVIRYHASKVSFLSFLFPSFFSFDNTMSGLCQPATSSCVNYVPLYLSCLVDMEEVRNNSLLCHTALKLWERTRRKFRYLLSVLFPWVKALIITETCVAKLMIKFLQHMLSLFYKPLPVPLHLYTLSLFLFLSLLLCSAIPPGSLLSFRTDCH